MFKCLLNDSWLCVRACAYSVCLLLSYQDHEGRIGDCHMEERPPLHPLTRKNVTGTFRYSYDLISIITSDQFHKEAFEWCKLRCCYMCVCVSLVHCITDQVGKFERYW